MAIAMTISMIILNSKPLNFFKLLNLNAPDGSENPAVWLT